MLRTLALTGLLFAAATLLPAYASFSGDQLKQLRDPAGWDYIKMTDTGMRTEHPCFTGKPPSDECSGRLVLGMDNHFIQEVVIHGQTVQRNGTYTLKGDQLTFVDELETKDGPYTVGFVPGTNSLVIAMPQVRIELRPHQEATPQNPKSNRLNTDQLKLLKDPAGWDYLRITDNGLVTDHPCFDGKAHDAECNARLRLGLDNNFIQETTVQGDTVPRHGTYTLEDDQMTFVDELGTPDGPYTVEVDTITKSLLLSTAQVRIELMLHKAVPNKRRKDASK